MSKSVANSIATKRQKNDAASEIAAALSERFTILKTVTESENHALYLARDLSNSAPGDQNSESLVMLKVLSEAASDSERLVSLFHLEARAAAKLSHKNIIKTAEAEQAGQIHFCVLEYKPQAETLRDLLIRESWLELDRATEIIKQVADALDYAHALGVLHLTLQPEKILVEPDGTVLVTDFGIQSEKDLLWARQERSHACAAQYISPEQVRCKQIDARSDLYSLGVIMFEVLTDRVPFDSQDSISIKLKHLNKPPEPPHMFRPELPRLLSWLVMDMLKKNPEERPADARAFQATLQQCMQSPLDDEPDLATGNSDDESAESLNFAPQVASVEMAPAPSDLMAAGQSVDEVAPDDQPLPLIINDDDTPAIIDTPRFNQEPYEARAPELQVSPAMAEATSSRRSRGLAWLIVLMLVAALSLVWAMRATRARNSAGLQPPVPATNAASSKDQEAAETVAQKPERPTLNVRPAESEQVIQAQAEKSVVKNRHEAVDIPAKQAEPVSARELPKKARPTALMPPVVSTLPSVADVQTDTPSAVDRIELGNARMAEPPLAAQPKREESAAPKLIRRSGDVLQNSAISRVSPVYPEAAKSARIAGPVTVEVTVDEEGNVIAARAISGPDQLKEAAVSAARGWKWMPARIDRAR
ncbi:MAG TPA: TonB family protein, partial [Blastocatellia bacterium]